METSGLLVTPDIPSFWEERGIRVTPEIIKEYFKIYGLNYLVLNDWAVIFQRNPCLCEIFASEPYNRIQEHLEEKGKNCPKWVYGPFPFAYEIAKRMHASWIPSGCLDDMDFS